MVIQERAGAWRPTLPVVPEIKSRVGSHPAHGRMLTVQAAFNGKLFTGAIIIEPDNRASSEAIAVLFEGMAAAVREKPEGRPIQPAVSVPLMGAVS